MSKLLVMCEGANEKKIIEMLLEENKLTFTTNDLIGLVPYHARQLSSPMIKLALSIYSGEVEILRVGDTQTDILTIPKELKKRIKSIKKYCTKPELEMILIINENQIKQFNSQSISPKQFAKKNVVYNKRKYDNSTSFFSEYYKGRVDILASNLREYKRIKKHNSDELFLADLLI